MGRYRNSGLAHGTSGSPQGTIEQSNYKNKVEELTEKANLKSKNSSIASNADNMNSDYPRSPGGYFGEKGKNCRIIKSNDPVSTSIDFYNRIGANGVKTNLPNGKGTKTVLSDGTVIVHRIVTSTKGSPAIEISVSGSPNVKNQKIHFIMEVEK